MYQFISVGFDLKSTLNEVKMERYERVSYFVPFKCDNKNSLIIKKFKRQPFYRYSHVEIMRKLDIVDLNNGLKAAGNRGYFLKGFGLDLNLALVKFGLEYLETQQHVKLWAPLFLRKQIMKKCVQILDFKNQLYKIPIAKNTFYLIATAEQAICSQMYNNTYKISDLPLKLCCYSTCFRKEAGSHGIDSGGLFRVHQFEKIEQFIISYSRYFLKNKEFQLLLERSEKFYQQIRLPYQIVEMNSSELNSFSFIKYDIEAWFPGSKTYREVVSCTNCLNMQSNSLKSKIKTQNSFDCDMCTFNSTLAATERLMCALVENFQVKEGVKIPHCLRKYCNNKKFLKFNAFF
mmetsp:Transcript_15196/g.18255  ORF Transcript_15196/g.18255 Transcript_15196/m.18255 type:complete len:346 (+) Transcript_15196:196-1233(+)